MKRLIVHIGSEKTATTLIQRFLQKSRQELMTQGIYYPEIGFNSMAHSSLVAPLHEIDQGRPLEFAPNQVVGAYTIDSEWAPLINEINKREDIHTIILSSEHFSSRLRDEGVSALKQILLDMHATVDIVYYFRRQDDLLASAYSTHIKSGGKLSLEKFYNNNKNSDWYYNFEHIISVWSSIINPSRVIVRPYDLVKKYILVDFCKSIGLYDEMYNLIGGFNDKSENESWSPRMLKIARLINVHNLIENNTERTGTLSKINRKLFVDDIKGNILSQEQRDEILKIYELSNRKLCDRYSYNYDEIFTQKLDQGSLSPDAINFGIKDFLNLIINLTD